MPAKIKVKNNLKFKIQIFKFNKKEQKNNLNYQDLQVNLVFLGTILWEVLILYFLLKDKKMREHLLQWFMQ